MKLSRLRDIIAVAETGSLRAASRKLGITQPTITRSIQDTEEEIGVALFNRSPTGVSLTDAGKLFVRRATLIQSEVRHIHEEMEQTKGSIVGELAVGMATEAGMALLPLVLPTFQREFPKATITLSEGLFPSFEHHILSGAMDLYIGPPQWERRRSPFTSKQLMDIPCYIVGRRGHPLRKATTLGELVEARWILPVVGTQGSETEFKRIFERAGLPPPTASARSRSSMMTLLSVAHSDMLTILPQPLLEQPQTAAQVEVFQVKQPFQGLSISILRRSDLPLTRLAERFHDLVARAAQNHTRSCVEGDQ